MAAAELAQRRLLILAEGLPGGGLDPVGNLGRSRLPVMHAGERRHRLGARLAAAHRHVGRLVGAEDRDRVFQRLQAAAEFVELFEGHEGFPFR